MRAPLRLLVALALAASAVALLLAVRDPGPAATAPATFHVQVVQADGQSLFNGTIEAANATALSLLQGAAAQGGFSLEVQGSGCPGAYVKSIAGQGPSGAGGWTFRIAHVGEDWGLPPSESSACCSLRPGDRLEWRWTTEGSLGPPCS